MLTPRQKKSYTTPQLNQDNVYISLVQLSCPTGFHEENGVCVPDGMGQ